MESRPPVAALLLSTMSSSSSEASSSSSAEDSSFPNDSSSSSLSDEPVVDDSSDAASSSPSFSPSFVAFISAASSSVFFDAPSSAFSSSSLFDLNRLLSLCKSPTFLGFCAGGGASGSGFVSSFLASASSDLALELLALLSPLVSFLPLLVVEETSCSDLDDLSDLVDVRALADLVDSLDLDRDKVGGGSSLSFLFLSAALGGFRCGSAPSFFFFFLWDDSSDLPLEPLAFLSAFTSCFAVLSCTTCSSELDDGDASSSLSSPSLKLTGSLRTCLSGGGGG